MWAVTLAPQTQAHITSAREIPEDLKRKIGLMCDVDSEAVIACPDARSIYDIPKVLHREALDAVLELIEDRFLFTRTGTNSCMQVETQGLIAAAFDHYDSRAGDPNLHTHVVIANKVRGPDGLWRSVDAQVLYRAE